MSLINGIGAWYFKNRTKNIFDAVQNPLPLQENTLHKLINTAKETYFGKLFQFNQIKNYESFSKLVPISSYEEFYPMIDKLLKGEENVVWPGEIQWFAKSSGTTNNVSKFIPVSFETMEQCHFEGGKDALAIHCYQQPNTKIFDGKGLLIGGSHKANPENKKSNYGDLSALLMNEMPFWASLIKTPNLSIALIEDWEEKIEKMAINTMNENVTSISGVPTWTMAVLKKVLTLSNKSNIKSVWPNLELFVHGGINFTPYKDAFYDLIGTDKINFIETYNASEGFFGLQLVQGENMNLMPQYGIYYEFRNTKTGEICNLSKIETQVQYEVIISTASGLWRYCIGDTLIFTQKIPFKFIITGRTKSCINAFGEELMVHNADTALEKTCKKHQVNLQEYTAAPIFSHNETSLGTHEWIIAFDKLPVNEEQFKIDFDNALKALNSDYAAKRAHNLAMDTPVIHLTSKKVFYNWLAKKEKLGGQNKIPRLSENRVFIKDILQYL